MAYVGITQALKGEIRHTISGLCKKEISALGEPPQVIPTVAEAEAAYWGNYLHLRDQIPQRWKSQEHQILVVIYEEDGKTPIYRNYHYLSSYIPAPPRIEGQNVIIPLSDPRAQAYAKWYTNHKDISMRWNKVQDTIIGFLNTCKSLNEAVKLMPEVAHYVPNYLLEKLEEKRGPRKKESTAVVPDQEARDEMLASLVAARIS